MKRLICNLIFVLLCCTASYGQSEVTLKCKTCGKSINECKYKGKHPPAPTYITAGGSYTLNLSVDYKGGTKEVSVATDAQTWNTYAVPSWCTVVSKKNTYFTLRIQENTSKESRSDWMEIRTPNGKSARINISQSARPANNGTYIRIDGNASVSKSYSATGASEVFYITTDANDWTTWGVPSWCSIENKTATSFRLKVSENTSSTSRSYYMKVKTLNGQEARLNIEQEGKKVVTTINSDKLNGIINLLKRNARRTDSGRDYVKARNFPGYRLYIWDDNCMRIGWTNASGQQDRQGIFVVSPLKEAWNVTNCPEARFFVGNWSNQYKSGTGTCYDKDGKLIYYGNFSSDRPTGTYPMTGHSSYRFELHEYATDYYIGETKDGVRHGLGIYVWENGACWYGQWRDGVRSGWGVEISSTGEFTVGEWEGDTMK